jgi:serine/threonine protein kinase/TPR repeat protein
MNQEDFFNRYEYDIQENIIGAGSFGTVYKAYDTFLSKDVAIKIALVKHLGKREFSLLEEYNIIKSLEDHKNIANYTKVFRFESPSGLHDYAIMQYYPDGNLSDYLKRHSLSIEKKEQLILDILDGVTFLHKNKVIHRDLKPSNILIVNRKGNLTPKITDFGISKKALSVKASRFTSSFVGGTLQYGSPEQHRGEPLKYNTDLWSFGVIVYEIFIEKPLFGSKEQNTIIQNVLNKDVDFELKKLPQKWQEVASACLLRDPSERVQNTDKLWEILNHSEEETIVLDISNNNQNNKTDIKPKLIKYVAILLVIFFFGSISYNLLIPEDQMQEQTSITLDIFEDNGLFGYKLGDSIVISAKFTKAGRFTNGKALVEKDSSYYIDSEGLWLETIRPSTNDVVENTLVNNKEQNKKDNLIESSHSVNDLKKNKYDGKWGFVHKTSNQVIIPYLYQDVGDFYNGLALAKKNNKWGYIDKSGMSITRFEYLIAEDFSEGLAAVKKNNKWGFINTQGKIVIPIQYEDVESFYDGIAEVRRNGELYEIDKQGKQIKDGSLKPIPIEYENKNMSGEELNAWVNKDNNFAILDHAARTGNRIAERRLGKVYIALKNEKEAIKWLEKASKKEDVFAMIYLGSIYKNKGTKYGYKKAFYWYLKAAKKEFTPAQIQLAYMYKEGLGISKQPHEYLSWIKKAAEKGDYQGQFILGNIFLEGKIVKSDKEIAIKLFKKSCNQGYQLACNDLEKLEIQISNFQEYNDQLLRAKEFINANGIFWCKNNDNCKKDAIKHLENAIKVYPQGSEAKQILNLLEK